MKYKLETRTPAAKGLDFSNELNPQQLAAVEANPQRLLILAGAGTGKTRTLTYRVARLAARGCPPERIMLVTFTNRAAREMIDRVEGILGPTMRRCEAGTFHHVGNRILRRYAPALGLGDDFSILDPEDARDLLGQCIAELGLQTLTAKRFPTPKVVASMIGLASGSLKPLSQIVRDRFSQFAERAGTLETIAARYAARKRELNACDFDDLLTHWYRLLMREDTRAIGQELRESYDHLLVDEYQDINSLQAHIIDEMARRHGSLSCVGDDAQSIYSFRGADFRQIRSFRDRHRDAQLLELTINYRSTPEILALANRSLARNKRQYKKDLLPQRPRGTVPAVIPLRDVYQQAEFVAQRVLEIHHEQDLALRSICVLYRNHAHGLELQVELSRRQIPYSVRSGVRFFEQTHIKDVVSFLRARENPRDGLAWLRMLRLWPGIGNQTAEKIARSLATSVQHGRPMLGADGPDTLSLPDAGPPGPELDEAGRIALCFEVLDELARTARGRQKPSLQGLARLWKQLREPGLHNPGDLIDSIVKLHYGDYAERSFPNASTRRDDLTQLAQYSRRYGSTRDFLSELALVQGISAEQVVAGEEPDDKLTLSTIHQAKGLEWRAVFIVGLADGRFPMAQTLAQPEQLEEERRLFYVASTRARDDLYMCYPTIEEGRDGSRKLIRPSRFLSEIDHSPAVFERWEIEEAPTESELPPA